MFTCEKHVFNAIPCKTAATVDKLYIRYLTQPQQLTRPTSHANKAATKFPVNVTILTAGNKAFQINLIIILG